MITETFFLAEVLAEVLVRQKFRDHASDLGSCPYGPVSEAHGDLFTIELTSTGAGPGRADLDLPACPSMILLRVARLIS